MLLCTGSGEEVERKWRVQEPSRREKEKHKEEQNSFCADVIKLKRMIFLK